MTTRLSRTLSAVFAAIVALMWIAAPSVAADRKLMVVGTAPAGSAKLEADRTLMARGIIVQKDLPEYCREYDKIIDRAQATGS